MSKELKHGRITAYTADNNIIIAGLKCQTDFLARSEPLIKGLTDICELLVKSHSKDQIVSLIDKLKADSREEIELLCTSKISFAAQSPVSYYLHHDDRKAAVIKFLIENDESDILSHRDKINNLGKDIAMHVVAFDPKHISMDKVNWDEVDLEIPEKMKDKPADILEKIKEGKKKKYGTTHVLHNQPFAKDLKKTVLEVIDEFNKENNLNVAILDYCRMEV